jgi:hypothetical protein
LNNFENVKPYLDSEVESIRTIAILSLGNLPFEEFELALAFLETKYLTHQEKNYVRKIKSKFLLNKPKTNVIDEREI